MMLRMALRSTVFLALLILVPLDATLVSVVGVHHGTALVVDPSLSNRRVRMVREPIRVFSFVPFSVRVSMGIVDGFEAFQKFGRNPNVSAAADEDVWSVGGTYVFPSGAETLDVVSDSDEDQPTGDGCGTVEIFGLDADYNEITEVVTLGGLAPATTTKSFLRASRAICRTPGDGSLLDVNLGTLLMTQSISGITVMNVLPLNRWPIRYKNPSQSSLDFSLCLQYAYYAKSDRQFTARGGSRPQSETSP